MLVKTKGSVENLVFSGTALCCNIVFFLTFRAHHDRNWNSWFNWHDFIFCPKFNFLYFHKFLVKLNEKCGFCRQIYFLFISFYGTSNNRVWLDFHSFFTLLRQTNLKTYLSQWWLPAPFKLLNKTSESAFWTAKIPFGRLCRFWLKIYTFLSYWYENPNPKSMKITTKRQRQRGVTVSITFLKQPGHWSDIIRANWKKDKWLFSKVNQVNQVKQANGAPLARFIPWLPWPWYQKSASKLFSRCPHSLIHSLTVLKLSRVS